MMDPFYEGKNILVTGCTGFVGKVLLEKLLWDLPQVNRIYVLVRPKKGSSAAERFQKDIVDSPCFDRLRAREPEFHNFMQLKVAPIAGDMLKDGLSLSEADYQELIQNVNIIFNSAASVDFNQRLDQALQINTYGTLKVLQLAKACRSLVSFVQVSTAYVNSDRRGWVEERIYPMMRDPHMLLEELSVLTVDEIERRLPEILGSFPNTYTFTKNLTEHLLVEEARNMPLCILRPTIIGGSWKEPYTGWVDSVAAAGAYYLMAGLGVVKTAIGNGNNIGDQVPVDTVTNAMLVAAALLCSREELNVVHVGTSALNPVLWGKCAEVVQAYWRRHPPEKRVSRVNFNFYQNKKLYGVVRACKRKIPAFLFLKYAQTTKNPNLLKTALKLQKLISREHMISSTFSHFTMNEWIYSSQNLIEMQKHMNKEERSRFELDITKLDWHIYLSNFTYGLQKFILKEKVQPPSDADSVDLNWEYKTRKYFSDIMWAYSSGEQQKVRGRRETRSLVLNAPKVQNMMKKIIEEELTKGKSQAQAAKDVQNRANFIINRMSCDLRMPMVRFFGWSLRKIWRMIYEKIVVDQNALNRLKKYMSKNQGPVVIMPTHRSYIDFLIVSYVFFSFKIKLPYIAAGEDFLNIALINHLLRMTGAFFIKRKMADDKLYMAILTEYIQQLLKDQEMVEFFIEGTRSRTGKTLHPKFGMLSMCTEILFDKDVPDLTVVPVTINYDRVLEGETFPFELLGEQKVQESLSRIVKAAKILNMNFGKIYVGIGEPISVKEFVKQLPYEPYENKQDRHSVNKILGYELVFKFQENLVIMPTALVAAILLMHRRGVSEDELITKVEWLRDEIMIRGFKVGGMDGGSAQIAVRNAIYHLNQAVAHKKDMFEPSVSLANDYKNILLLSFYRNTMQHIFAEESLLACTLYSFGDKIAWEEGVPQERLLEEASFLFSLLDSEFVSRKALSQLDTIRDTISRMQKRGVVEIQENKVKISRKREMSITFLCSLIWPMIDSYWVLLLFCMALNSRQNIQSERAIQSVQWFAENLYQERALSFYESCSQENIKNAVGSLEKQQVLEKLPDQKSIRVNENYTEEKLQELVDHISNFRKASFIRSVNVNEDLRRAILAEFPEIPKL